MGYIKYNCKKFHDNYNQFQSKCCINKLEKALYEFDQIEEELKVEFLEVKEILEESKREIKAVMYLNNQQDEIDSKVIEWINNCKEICETNDDECTCSQVQIEEDKEIEDINALMKEALYLVEETLKKIMTAQEAINRKRETYDSIRSSCYEELSDDYKYCFDENGE